MPSRWSNSGGYRHHRHSRRLIVPGPLHSEEKAQGTYCLNSSKQLIAAVHLYAGDHNDWLPPNPEHSTPVAW
jgi:hypothetical protein